jgi:hypothetical protein
MRPSDLSTGDVAGCPSEWLACVAPLVASFVLSLPAAPARGQLPELPTLEGLGVEYLSRSGFLQLSLSGQLDLEATHVTNGWNEPPGDVTTCDACHVDVGRALLQGEGFLQAYRLRIFADLFLGDHVYSFVEVRSDKGLESFSSAPRARLEQAYVRFVDGSGGRGAQVGRFPSPFGSYTLRHLSVVDPFLRPPLPYEYRTVLSRVRVPADAPTFLAWKDRRDVADLPSAPPVWAVPYQWGAMVFTGLGPLELRAAAMNSAPSSWPKAWDLELDRFERPSWVVALRWRASAAIELGVAYDRGPWMEEIRTGTIHPPPGSPAGTAAPGWRDFNQELISADIAFARGRTMARAEAIIDRWEVPNVGATPTDLSLSVEVQHDLAAGLFVAVRGGLIDFRPLSDGLGTASPLPDGRTDWDYDVRRFEASIGYRLARNVGALLSAYEQRQIGAADGDTRVVGLRLWWAF